MRTRFALGAFMLTSACCVVAAACLGFPDYSADATFGGAVEPISPSGVISMPSDAGGDAAPEADATPATCNGASTTSWDVPIRLTDVHGVGTSALTFDPYVLPDGLTLLFTAPDSAGLHRIHFAGRADRGASFTGGSLLAGLDVDAFKSAGLDQPAADRLEEVLFTGPMQGGDLWVGTRASAAGPVTPRHYELAALNTIDAEGAPSLSADGKAMVFTRRASGARSKLFEARRDDATPGTDWTTVLELALNDPSFDVGCPALTGDGLTLVFSANDGGGGSSTAYVAQRPSITSPFGLRLPVPALTGGVTTCPRSISADGCELYFTSDRDVTSTVYVSRRLR